MASLNILVITSFSETAFLIIYGMYLYEEKDKFSELNLSKSLYFLSISSNNY
jgi:hypothetical protein